MSEAQERRLDTPASRILPPLVAFALQRTLLALGALFTGNSPFSSSSWARWDSVYYLHIAQAGYQPLEPCPPKIGFVAGSLCSNAGWFPGYSWLIGALLHLGFQPGQIAVAISTLAQLGCLWLLWRYLDDREAWPSLALGAFFLGNVYMAAIFPVSLSLFCALACLGACWSGRFGWSALAGAAAATCYPTGILLAPVIALWAVWHRRWRALAVPLAVAAGYATVLGVMQVQTGRWDAFFKVQSHYGYQIGFGVDAFFARFKPLFNAKFRNQKGVVIGCQEVLASAILFPIAAQTRRHLADPRTFLVLAYTAAFAIAPLLLGGALSWYRSEALLLPAVLLVPAFPRWAQWALVAAALCVSVPMCVLFFTGTLV